MQTTSRNNTSGAAFGDLIARMRAWENPTEHESSVYVRYNKQLNGLHTMEQINQFVSMLLARDVLPESSIINQLIKKMITCFNCMR